VRPSDYARRMKRLMGVVLAGMTTVVLAQGVWAPATVIDFAPQVRLPPLTEVLAGGLDGCQNYEGYVLRCYRSEIQMGTFMPLFSGWLEVAGFLLVSEAPGMDEHGRAKVQQEWWHEAGTLVAGYSAGEDETPTATVLIVIWAPLAERD